MRVLHVIPSVAPRDGGPSAAVAGICRALGACGVTAEIATTDADGALRLRVPIGRWQDHAGVKTIFFARVGATSFKWSPGLARWLASNCGTYDLVHVHAVFSHSTMAAARACRARGVPYVLRPLGALAAWSLARHPWRKALLLSAGLRTAIAGAVRVHYTSEGERLDAESRSPWLPPGAVIGLGVDDALFDVRPERHEGVPKTLLMLCRVDSKKGIDVAIDAAHLMAAEHDLGEWTLEVAGDGDADLLRSLRALAASGPAASRILFHGWVSGLERAALLARASVSLHPSLQENFGLSAVEALASGVPAVVSPVMDLASDISSSRSGWVCDRSPAALASGLATILRDETERRLRAANARAFAQRYRWTKVAAELQSLYEQVLTTAAGAA